MPTKLKEFLQQEASPQPDPGDGILLFAPGVLNALIHECRQNLPNQSFGVLTGDLPILCRSFHIFRENVRGRRPEIQRAFASYGPPYEDPGRGFWVDPREQLELFLRLDKSAQQVIAFFHTHRLRDARPTAIDCDLHFHRKLPMVIVSFSRIEQPRTRAFLCTDGRWKRLRIEQIRSDELLTNADPMR